MQKWEYKVLKKQGLSEDQALLEINRLGELGWEIVGQWDYMGLLFKRLKS